MAGPNNGETPLWEPPPSPLVIDVEGEVFKRVVVPRPLGSSVKIGTQTEEQAKLSRAEGQAPESGFIPQALAFLKSPGGMIVGGVVALFLLKRFWR